MARDQNERTSEVFNREKARLRNFIRRRVPDARDAEDILQSVFCELVAMNRLFMPIEHVTAWLFRVARNRAIDLFRKKSPGGFDELDSASSVAPDQTDDSGERFWFEELLPSPEAGPEVQYLRGVLIEELEIAIQELPQEQRRVFVGHELEGLSFKEMAALTGVSVNTLLSRKRYAVLHLRRKLQRTYDDFTRE